MDQIEALNKMKPCSEALPHPGWEELLALLGRYGVDRMESVGLIDTSYDEADIRWNYIIDKQYVLRFTNAPEMTEERFADLNRLPPSCRGRTGDSSTAGRSCRPTFPNT